MIRTKADAWYSFCFSVVNFVDATVLLLTLGQYDSQLVIKFASSYALNKIKKQKEINNVK